MGNSQMLNIQRIFAHREMSQTTEVTVLLCADVVRCLELCANIYPPYTTTHFLKKMQGNCILSEKLKGTKNEG